MLKNIVLIGMPGAGKSTAGVILAKTLGMTFTDTDIVLQEGAGRLLQDIIDSGGPAAFLAMEERTILSLDCQGTVIATGGSVVFSRAAMEHLKADGIVVYLKISCEEMERRLADITTRGIVLFAGQGLRDMYAVRAPLYEMYADITVDCTGAGFEAVVEKIVGELRRTGGQGAGRPRPGRRDRKPGSGP